MNKRYLAMGLFFCACSLYSAFQAFSGGFHLVPFTLFLTFGFLGVLFLRHLKR